MDLGETEADVPYLGSTWEQLLVPKDFGSASLIASPWSSGAQLTLVLQGLEHPGEDWTFSFPPPSAAEVSILLGSASLCHRDPFGVIGLPSKIREQLRVPAEGRPRVVLWGDSIIAAVDQQDVVVLDPHATPEGPGEWDFTGGFDEDVLLSAPELRHSLLAWPAGGDLERADLAQATRQFELILSELRRVLDNASQPGRDELWIALEAVNASLRQLKPQRNAVLLAVSFAAGVASSLLATALWELLRVPFTELLHVVK